MPNPPEDRKGKIKELANAIAVERDCDVMIFNFSFEGAFDYLFLKFLQERSPNEKYLLLFLVTEGGDADRAYRVARLLQENYKSISIAVPGGAKAPVHCGSVIGANELIVFDAGELGPLDVQIAKTDEVGEQESLDWRRSPHLRSYSKKSFKMFERHLRHIIEEIPGRITFRTAADISVHLVVGAMRDIFAKIEPMTVGEDYRSNLSRRGVCNAP